MSFLGSTRGAVLAAGRTLLCRHGLRQKHTAAPHTPTPATALGNSGATKDKAQPLIAQIGPRKAQRNPSNQELYARLQASASKHQAQQAWYWYQRLYNRSRRETPVASKWPPPAVTARKHQQSVSLLDIHGAMLGAISLRGMTKYTEPQLQEMTSMAQQVLKNASMDGRKISASELTRLLDFFATARRGGEAADYLWQYATLGGVVRDTASYNAYVNAKICAGQYERALEVIREMPSDGVQPNTYTYGCLLRLYGLTGDLEAARRTLEEIRTNSTVGSNSSSRKTRAKSGGMPDYLQGPSRMKGVCGLNIHVYTEMLNVLGMNGLLDEMRALFLELTGLPQATPLKEITPTMARKARETGGLWPTRKTFHTLIGWHARYWDLDGAIRYLDVMADAYGVRPDGRVLSLVVTRENAQRNLDVCSELVLHMHRRWQVAVPRAVAVELEHAAEEDRKMQEMIRIAEEQPSRLFPPPEPHQP
ncbi:hypothetical protein GGI07_003177 [Coemansia sp. Benny D115]|nr:hypothetical protein GGI07_003177 [Coemansia sp. Benny D115]